MHNPARDPSRSQTPENSLASASRTRRLRVQFPEAKPMPCLLADSLRNFMPLHATPFRAAAFALLLLAPAMSHARQAPSFNVKTLEGRALRLSEYRNRPVILDFWATWCGPCRASMPHLAAMQSRYEKQGLAVIGMSVDDGGPASVRKFANQLGVKFTLAMANDEILDAYGPIRSIPTTFFINRKGEIVRRVVGYIDGETMEDYVKEILE